MILKQDGSLWTMGFNGDGQLGDSSNTNREAPVSIESSGVTLISTDGNSSYYIKDDGSLWGMGLNQYGQLGDGTTENKNAPVEVESGGVVSVSAGEYFSSYLKSDGTLWAMGRNNYGQLGKGDFIDQTTGPIQVQSGVVQVSAGLHQTHILKDDNSLFATGRGEFGAIGTGSTDNISSFTEIELDDVYSLMDWPIDPRFSSYLIGQVAQKKVDGKNAGRDDARYNNPRSHDLYRDSDRQFLNADTASDSYQLGFSEGNFTRTEEIRQNPNAYGLYTILDREQAIAEGIALASAKVQAELAQEGLSLKFYEDAAMDASAIHTNGWFYQPDFGWMWSDRSAYPYVFLNEGSNWFYHNKESQEGYFYYNFTSQSWIDPY
jgi:hypothetical protein